MISKAEIETLAIKITEPDFKPTPENMLAVIGHLSQEEFLLVHARGMEIHEAWIEAKRAERSAMENLGRLARAAGVPDGEKVIPWLKEHGVAVEIKVEGGRLRSVKAPKPRAAE